MVIRFATSFWAADTYVGFHIRSARVLGSAKAAAQVTGTQGTGTEFFSFVQVICGSIDGYK